ncbi:MAG: DUF115 domain-containing protein [Candidatus Methanomethylophilaceae archaeon]|nr:DUF115 domain-containing protein [Candidatus Methanomethylophilaceae archaeon]MBR7006474.1 DUF115 domain-containing protein [Candidatus Methanomethylophilaceae archaeon]
MLFSEWEPVYERILSDMGYSREDDEYCVRVLISATLGSDLVSDDEAGSRVGPVCTVFGNAASLEDDVRRLGVEGTKVASGSSVSRLLRIGVFPDVVVTDLDGDIDAQLEASRGGALTLIHAHGDNADLVRSYAGLFKGPVALTTQSVPRDIVYDFGGFTDGDRAVCFVRHFGCRRILLPGFDYSTPYPKPGSDVAVKARKLRWAKEIIEGMNPPGVELVRRCHAFIR